MAACDVWELLHDAIVLSIKPQPEQGIRLELECDYLRDRLDDPGTRFFLIMENCTRFMYRPWSEEPVVDDLAQIEARRLWIVSAQHRDGACVVDCSEHIAQGSGGKLEITASKFTLTVDDGREVSIAELEEVAQEYWSGFNANKNP